MSSNLCGECNACCKRYNITDAFWRSDDKPRNTLCEKWCNGCEIYEERPKSCSDFECVWLKISKARDLSINLRPDKVGGMVTARMENGEGQLLIEEIEPGSFDPMNMTPEQQQLVSELVNLSSNQDVPTSLYIRSYDWKISKINFEIEKPCQ